MRMRKYFPGIVIASLISIFFFPVLAQSPSNVLQGVLDDLRQQNKSEQRELRQDEVLKKQELLDIERLLAERRQSLEKINEDNRLMEEEILSLQKLLVDRQDQLEKSRDDVKNILETTLVQYQSFVANASQFSSWRLAGAHVALSDDNLDIEAIERFWLEMAEQVVASAQVNTRTEDIVLKDGHVVRGEVFHAGPFSQYSEQYGWLKFVPGQNHWQQLAKQPDLSPSNENLIIDMAYGAGLELLAEEPGWIGQYEAAGIVGILITVVALCGTAIGVVRLFVLLRERSLVGKQLADMENFTRQSLLGRVFLEVKDCEKHQQIEDVIDAAVSREMPTLNRGIGTLAVLAAIAPLMGLLGTVGGMIETFSVLTAQGVSNNELLSGGIAEALLTTKMGLLTAIPLLLLHSLVKSRAQKLSELIEHQVAGLVVEKRYGRLSA